MRLQRLRGKHAQAPVVRVEIAQTEQEIQNQGPAQRRAEPAECPEIDLDGETVEPYGADVTTTAGCGSCPARPRTASMYGVDRL